MLNRNEHKIVICLLLLSSAIRCRLCFAKTLPKPITLDQSLYGSISGDEMRDNIASIYNARVTLENSFREDPVAKLAEEMSENSRDISCIYREQKTNIIYDNRTDFARQIKFSPTNYNCGKFFDVGKLLNLVKKYSKINPFKVGSDLENLDDQLKSEQNNGKNGTKNGSDPDTSEPYEPSTCGPKSTAIVGKEAFYKMRNTTTSPTIGGKSNWWLGGSPKEAAQEAKNIIKNVASNTSLTDMISETKKGKQSQMKTINANNFRKQQGPNFSEAKVKGTTGPNRLINVPQKLVKNLKINSKLSSVLKNDNPQKFINSQKIEKLIQNEIPINVGNSQPVKVQKEVNQETPLKNIQTNQAQIKKFDGNFEMQKQNNPQLANSKPKQETYIHAQVSNSPPAINH